MVTFDADARRARIHARGASASGGSRPGETPIDGRLVCYYPCPRCSNPARALVYLGDAALASEVVAQDKDVARHLELLAVGAGLAHKFVPRILRIRGHLAVRFSQTIRTL